MTESDEIYEVEFDRYEPLAGFVGYINSDVKALGFYRYKCAERPEDLPVVVPEVPTQDEIDEALEELAE